jgi:predicted RNase H-like HicB family nuclease
MLADLAVNYVNEPYCLETAGGFSRVLDKAPAARERDRTGSDIIKIESILSRAKAKSKYPLWKFCKNNAPLSAAVQFEGGHWFAELEWLNISAEGASPQEALSDLEQHIEHFITFYERKKPEELTPFAAELKGRFAQLVRT